MPPDITAVLIDLVKGIKEDVKEVSTEVTAVREKVDEATVNIAVVETMQRAIEQLKLNERLTKVESTVTLCDAVVLEFKEFRKYIYGTMISVLVMIIFELVKFIGGAK